MLLTNDDGFLGEVSFAAPRDNAHLPDGHVSDASRFLGP